MINNCATNECKVLLNSKCVVYESTPLPYSGIDTNDNLELILQKIDAALGLGGSGGSSIWGTLTGLVTNQIDLISYLNSTYVPITRNITINGITYNLATDRVWTINSESTFLTDVTFVLSGSKSYGKYLNGQTAPWTGLTAREAIIDAAIEYINPIFTSFSISGQPQTVETGTTLFGSKTFVWGINQNSGVVSTIDLFDVTLGTTLLSNTTNDGSEVKTINSVSLNSNGATQTWRGIGHNTAPIGNFNSSDFTVTSRFLRFYGPTITNPTNNTSARALPITEFHPGTSTFILNTGNTFVKRAVALPPGVTISTVFDLDALNANITANYILSGTIIIIDAGGTNRSYNLYIMTDAVPYSANHRHSISTNS